MSEDDSYDKTAPWILNKMIRVSEYVLESDKSANLLIIILVILIAIPFLGIGIVATRATAPIDRVEMGN